MITKSPSKSSVFYVIVNPVATMRVKSLTIYAGIVMVGSYWRKYMTMLTIQIL